MRQVLSDEEIDLALGVYGSFGGWIDARKIETAILEKLADRLKDAERYAWLCSHTIIPCPSLWDNGVGFTTPTFTQKRGVMSKEALDAAIDAQVSLTLKGSQPCN